MRMRRKRKEDGGLGLDEEEKKMLHGAAAQHEIEEGAAALADAWLCAGRPMLQQCKFQAKESKRRREKERKAARSAARNAGRGSARSAARAAARGASVDDASTKINGEKGGNEDDDSILPAGDNASVADDAAVSSDLPDFDFSAGLGLDEGPGAQAGNKLRPPLRQWSAPPQCCCAADVRLFIKEI